VKLKFSSRLYAKRAVLDAMRRYDRFARFKITETPRAFHVEISRVREGLEDKLPGEFSNYVLVSTREAA